MLGTNFGLLFYGDVSVMYNFTIRYTAVISRHFSKYYKVNQNPQYFNSWSSKHTAFGSVVQSLSDWNFSGTTVQPNIQHIPLWRHLFLFLNQRTNGPVNAHLITGATVSTKTSLSKFDIVLKWVKVNSGSSFI